MYRHKVSAEPTYGLKTRKPPAQRHPGNLGRRHYGSQVYQLFKELQYNGEDPMEFRDYLVKVQKACKGEWPCLH